MLRTSSRRRSKINAEEVDPEAGITPKSKQIKLELHDVLEGENHVSQPLQQKPIMKSEKASTSKRGYVSAYEESIQKNIQERMAMLRQLKLGDMKEEVLADITAKKPRKFVRPAKPAVPKQQGPIRRSLRISKRPPSTEVPPARPESPEERPRKLGKEQLREAGLTSGEDAESFVADLLDRLAKQPKRDSIPTDSYTESLTGLAVTEETWTKVAQQRVTGMAFCPLRSKLVVAAADKSGVLGLWDVSRGDEGVHQLEPHHKHIYGLSFAPQDGNKCFTTSYDGLTRQLDMEKLQFDQVYATPDNDTYLMHHAHLGTSSLLIGQSDGRLVQVDLRSGEAVKHRLGDRGIRWVNVHPTREHTFVTAQKPSLVSLWDMRYLRPSGALCRIEMDRACSSASISLRSGDNLVTASTDDTIRIYGGVNAGTLTPTKTIRHCNKTGRWLTPFKPTWLPGSDDLFLIGSMEQPRRMEVFDRTGPMYHLLMGPAMQSVCSTIVCHPTEPAIAGGNSSGRVYLFQ